MNIKYAARENFIDALNSTRDPAANPNWTLDALASSPEKSRMVLRTLQRNGLNNISPQLLGGNMAVVIELPQQRVLRISDSTIEPQRARDWKILQPVSNLGTIAGFNVEILPKVKTLDSAIKNGEIEKQEAAALIRQSISEFREQGQFLWDCKPENFCLIKSGNNNVLFLLDSGALAPLSQMHEGRMGNDSQTNLDKFKSNMTNTMNQLDCPDTAIALNPEEYLKSLASNSPMADYESVQRNHVSSMGLQYGQIKPKNTIFAIG
jgi:hypothetical protein